MVDRTMPRYCYMCYYYYMCNYGNWRIQVHYKVKKGLILLRQYLLVDLSNNFALSLKKINFYFFCLALEVSWPSRGHGFQFEKHCLNGYKLIEFKISIQTEILQYPMFPSVHSSVSLNIFIDC